MGEKASQGWFPGQAPFGYRNVRDGKVDKHGRKEKVIEDSIKKPILLKVMRLRAFERKDYYTIAKTLKENGDIPKGVHFFFKQRNKFLGPIIFFFIPVISNGWEKSIKAIIPFIFPPIGLS